MRFLRLTLGPEIVPLGRSVKRIEVLNNQYLTDGTAIELSRIESDHSVDKLFEENSSTIDYEVLDTEGDQQYVYHHLQPDEGDVAHQLISLLDEHRLMVVYPMRFDSETGATVTLMGTTEMVQEAFRKLPAEIQRHITIDQVTETMPSLGGVRSLLTERQREVLDAAVDLGYYSVPRQATAYDVADAAGCAPSTASEHLRKIEARVLSDLAN